MADDHLEPPPSGSMDPNSAAKTPSLARTDEVDEKLLEALRIFVQKQGIPKPDAPERIGFADAAWLIAAFTCLSLGLALVSDEWLKSEAGKILKDQLVPWFLNLGAVAAILKSPDKVLAYTRNSAFRWTVPAAAVVLVLLVSPIFRVDASIKPAGEKVPLFVDGQLEERNPFPVNFRTHPIELRPDGVAPTRRTLGRKELLAGLLHGLIVQPEWRIVYRSSLLVTEPDITICLLPDFDIDSQFIAQAGKNFDPIGPRALKFRAEGGTADIDLPTGSYAVTAHRMNCGEAMSQSLVVPQVETDQQLNQVGSDCNHLPSPCDRSAGGKSAQ